jgi:septal ring factor EnvC (AmiA/AmiB activator)
MFPWKFLLGLLVPHIPEIISTVKALKKEQQREKVQLDDTAARLQELERRIEAQLQLIEQLTVQLVALEKVFVWTLWAAIFAAVLALLALGAMFFK